MNNQDQYNPGVCCYCGSDKFSIVVTGPVVPVLACAECGLMRQGILSTAKTWSIVSYAGGKDRFFRQREDKEVLQVKDYLKLLPQLEKFVPQKGRLLEIGCAMGTLLNEIRKRGWNVTGIEPEEWTCELARKNYGLHVINSTFQEAGIEDSYFDAVLMLHVIEHLPNPAKGLLQIARMIRPDGYLIIETPRYDTLWFRLLKGRERSIIPGHLYYFTRQTIQAIARKSGFEVVKLESVGRTVTLDRLCFYAAKSLNSDRATKSLTFVSDSLHLNKIHLYINLRDMMRLYLRKVG
jgi:2-polyprenyl-3-methyl-5-hydroxy-6-metoxy-1,4-benzoquinol methylase